MYIYSVITKLHQESQYSLIKICHVVVPYSSGNGENVWVEDDIVRIETNLNENYVVVVVIFINFINLWAAPV